MLFKSKILSLFKEKLSITFTQSELDSFEIGLNKTIEEYMQLINDENKLEWVHISEILYIDREGQYAKFYCNKAIYKQFFSYEMLLDIVEKFDFEVSDNKVIINMENLKWYDSDKGRIYFCEEVSKDSRYAYLSKRNAPKFRKRFGKEIDLGLNEAIKDKGMFDLKKTFFNTF